MCEPIHNDETFLFFFNTNNFNGFWTAPDADLSQQPLLNSDEIRVQIDQCTLSFNKVEEWRNNSSFLISLQSLVRMFLQRRRYQSRLAYLKRGVS